MWHMWRNRTPRTGRGHPTVRRSTYLSFCMLWDILEVFEWKQIPLPVSMLLIQTQVISCIFLHKFTESQVLRVSNRNSRRQLNMLYLFWPWGRRRGDFFWVTTGRIWNLQVCICSVIVSVSLRPDLRKKKKVNISFSRIKNIKGNKPCLMLRTPHHHHHQKHEVLWLSAILLRLRGRVPSSLGVLSGVFSTSSSFVCSSLSC